MKFKFDCSVEYNNDYEYYPLSVIMVEINARLCLRKILYITI